jgi:hypothetical protein
MAQSNAGPVTVFFSYSRRDKKLRDRLDTFLASLTQDGLVAGWHDRMIAPGMDWAQQISEELESARIILLLVSMDFIASKYCSEVEVTRALQRHDDGEARVIPIILRPSDWQHTRFAYLNALPEGGRPVTSWRDRDQAYLSIASGIRTVVEEFRRGAALKPLDKPALPLDSAHPSFLSRSPVGNTLPEIRPKPIPETGATPILETGTVAIDSPFYVPRRSDELAAQQLESKTPTVTIKGSRQSGKSSFLTRLHHGAIERGDRSCYISLLDADEKSLGDETLLFPELARMMVDELEVDVDPDQFWRSQSKYDPPKQILTTFLEEQLLPSGPGALQLLFDEIDQVFDKPRCREELFTMMRNSWHERRQRARPGSIWKRLRLVVAHATDPALWVRDIKKSPFNVGRQLTLEDFDQDQVKELNRRHGRPLSEPGDVDRLMSLVGGHPHLIRIALYTLTVEYWTLDRLESIACDEGSPFTHHLSYYQAILSKTPKLRAEVRRILRDGSCSNETLFQNLWVAGLIRGKDRKKVAMRCRLYHDYFDARI